MLSAQDKTAIIQTASQYGVSKVLLFGSSAAVEQEGRDIDLAIEGISASLFFKFYGELIFKVSKPLDLVDLSQQNAFTQIIRQEGIVLYERSENPS